MISINYTRFQIKHWNMLYHVHTCIAIFFHISYNPVSTHSINQNNYYKICFTKTVETLWLTKHYFWFHKMLLISHVSSRPNWYSAHAGCNQRVFFSFFKNCYYFSDLEIQWLRNPELKSSTFIRGGKSEYWRKKVSALFCLSSTFIRGGKSQYWKKKSLSSVSELLYSRC